MRCAKMILRLTNPSTIAVSGVKTKKRKKKKSTERPEAPAGSDPESTDSTQDGAEDRGGGGGAEEGKHEKPEGRTKEDQRDAREKRRARRVTLCGDAATHSSAASAMDIDHGEPAEAKASTDVNMDFDATDTDNEADGDEGSEGEDEEGEDAKPTEEKDEKEEEEDEEENEVGEGANQTVEKKQTKTNPGKKKVERARAVRQGAHADGKGELPSSSSSSEEAGENAKETEPKAQEIPSQANDDSHGSQATKNEASPAPSRPPSADKVMVDLTNPDAVSLATRRRLMVTHPTDTAHARHYNLPCHCDFTQIRRPGDSHPISQSHGMHITAPSRGNG